MAEHKTPPAKSELVFDALREYAKNMRTVTYGDLAHATGLASFGIGIQLGYIRDAICRVRRLPWLNALAVNAQTLRPGDSFLPTGMAVTEEDEVFWRGMVLQVYAYDWSKVIFAD